jgi:FKBP-type peptidyl-prolyl cis-trans isomerase 2
MGSFELDEPLKPLCRGIVAAVRTMRQGERCTVTIAPERGYAADDPGVKDSLPSCAIGASSPYRSRPRQLLSVCI